MLISARAAGAISSISISSLPRRHPATTLLRKSTIRMSSSATQNQIIEHIVLFKAKPTADPASVAAMITNLNSLATLDPVLHLYAGPIIQSRSKTLTFTHMLHSRYRSKPDLVSYSDHPDHVSVVANYVKPVVDDVMAVDWVSDDVPAGAEAVPPGSAVRLTVLKVKEGAGESGKGEVLRVLSGVREKFPAIGQMSVGENFSPGRAKGYSICSLAVCGGVEGLEELGRDAEAVEGEKGKVREFLDGVVVLDYVVGALVKTASL